MSIVPLLDIRIETPRLLLRSPSESDVEAVASELNDLDVVRTLARVPFPYSRADALAFLSSSRESALRGKAVNLVITSNGAAIGCVGLDDYPATNELGYWLGRKHWRQGIATEAVKAFVSWCFLELCVKEIRSGAFVDNPPSLRVQEKLGFLQIGTSLRPSLARGYAVQHIDTILTHEGFKASDP